MELVHRSLFPSVVALLSAATLAVGSASSLTAPTVTLDYGIVHGVQTSVPDADVPVNRYLGIPYAEPPQRFSRATKPLPREEPIDASSFGPACIQSWMVPDSGVWADAELLQDVANNPPLPESEDCLSINVFTPAYGGKDRRLLPVLVFIHGGGWQTGSGTIEALADFAGYDGIVAVSMNYRTNVFGFPAAPEIPITERNLGIFDQQLALDWVQEHISNFGGDPRKVTIWGLSAGSMSVDANLQIHADDDESRPFRAAIMTSGQMSFGPLAVRQSNDEAWKALANIVGCTGDGDGDGDGALACMRDAPAQLLTDAVANNSLSFAPSNDNLTAFGDAADRWRTGRVAHVPVLTSNVAQEGTLLLNRHVDLAAFWDAIFPPPLLSAEAKEAILAAYPRGPDTTDFDIASAIFTDFMWHCPQAILANQSAANGIPTWRYHFNASTAGLMPAYYPWLGKAHGSELFLLASNRTSTNVVVDGAGKEEEGWTPQTYALSAYLRHMFAQFARNPFAGPGWPSVGSRFAPFDIAVLGDAGDARTAGATPTDAAVVDTICDLYNPMYPFLELAGS